MNYTIFTGAVIKSEKPFLKRCPNAASIEVSDYTPNYKFQKLSETGWIEVDRNIAGKEPNFFDGKTVWYRRSTSMGPSRIYIKDEAGNDNK